MKRFVVAGLFIVFGFIVLGVATAHLMSGASKPADKSHMAGPGAGNPAKPASRGAGADTNVVQPTLPSTKPAQPAAAAGGSPMQVPGVSGLSPPSPGMPDSLTTVQPTLPRPSPQASQHVPIIQPTDVGTPSSPTAGRQHQ